MAHAVPTGGPSTRAPSTGTGMRGRPRTPDVFSERTHLVARWTLLLAAGLVYGYWAASIHRFGGPITGWNVLLGLLSTLGFIVLYAVVRAVGRRLPREGHAVLWGAFAGSALGFLYAQSGVAMFTCVLVSLLVGAGVAGAMFYRYYTHEDARGLRVT
ncbi:hypothetical protein [Streptomyces sp. NPDC017230]|uniref:hypothetical protein n=1 Tax=unclassified Streptomyces TaxID=2593676 RepID=UPI0037A7E4C3